MRIINSVLGDATGGRWKVVCEYSRVLQARGHRVLMLLGPRQAVHAGQIPRGVSAAITHSHGHYDFIAAWKARKELLGFQPDIALAHCSRSVALLKRALSGAAPVVAVTHSNKVKRLLQADAYFALTSHIRHNIEQASTPRLTKPCFVVPNWITLDPGHELPPRQMSEPPIIAALGRFDSVKGFDVFIRALAQLKSRGASFRALLGGGGAEERALRSLAVELDLTHDVHFAGWVDDVDAFLSGVDILCVPARSDAFGLTPLQAAAAGVPMVLSRAAGHLEMFTEPGEALFCEIDDPPSTGAQILRLVRDQAQAARQRQGAHARVQQAYSEQAVVERLIQAIETIVNK